MDGNKLVSDSSCLAPGMMIDQPWSAATQQAHEEQENSRLDKKLKISVFEKRKLVAEK
jgi:hypothetical protein